MCHKTFKDVFLCYLHRKEDEAIKASKSDLSKFQYSIDLLGMIQHYHFFYPF